VVLAESGVTVRMVDPFEPSKTTPWRSDGGPCLPDRLLTLEGFDLGCLLSWSLGSYLEAFIVVFPGLVQPIARTYAAVACSHSHRYLELL
jgi:hypothetical protein